MSSGSDSFGWCSTEHFDRDLTSSAQAIDCFLIDHGLMLSVF